MTKRKQVKKRKRSNWLQVIRDTDRLLRKADRRLTHALTRWV